MRQEHRGPVLGSQAQTATEVRGCLKDPGRGPGLWPLLQAPPPDPSMWLKPSFQQPSC